MVCCRLRVQAIRSSWLTTASLRMFIPVPALLAAIIVAVIGGLWGRARLNAKIKQEKEVSFGFAIGAILQSILVIDAVERVKYIANRLTSYRPSSTAMEQLIRAGSLLSSIRGSLDRNTEASATLIDVGGEHLRHLGVSAAAVAGEPMARELAKLAVFECEKSPDSLPWDELCVALVDRDKLALVGEDRLRRWMENQSPWGVLLAEVRDHDALKYNSQDMSKAQLLIEREILKIYAGGKNELSSKFTTDQRERFSDAVDWLERKS